MLTVTCVCGKKKYSEALEFVKKARQLFPSEKGETLASRRFNERLKLLEKREEIEILRKKWIHEV